MTAEDNTNEESLGERLDQRSLNVKGSVDDSTVVVGDRNTINEGPRYYTTNVFGAFETKQFSARPSQQLSQEEYRWRQVLVQNVKRYWIEGVLERSLHNQVLIELGLEDRGQAVAAPIGEAEEFAKDAGRPFPAGTQATNIFDGLGAGRTLLILGEPGAGKTTTLLKLTKTLIARIGDDFSQPIPVVLNLSSWTKKRQPIDKWLVQELYETFQVSKSLGATWIKEEQLTLCLDGLDEVAVEHREDCLKALNQFLQLYGRTEVVVCSRIRDYEALSERLKVKCAIYVQPLTAQQIDQYLDQAGEQLLALSAVFSHSPDIKAFAASPLILSVMSLAYQGRSFNEFSNVDSAQDFRHQLFDMYIERMFLRRGKIHTYTEQQATYWLVWMAQRMVQTSQTVFFIENMQPSWFQTQGRRLWYRIESSLFFGLVCGLFFALIDSLTDGIVDGLKIGLIDGLFVAMLDGLIDGLIIALVAGLIAMTLGNIKPVETFRISWLGTLRALTSGLFFGLLFGLLYELVVTFILEKIFEINVGLTLGLSSGLSSGLLFGLVFGLVFGLRGSGIDDKGTPNQGIWKSSRNAMVMSSIAGLIVGLSFGLIAGPLDGLTYGLIYGLIAGLISGGSACIRHFSLRWMIYRMGRAPWNYARFLDYASERLFLQKVGGGYVFVHRMLLEHFAQMKLVQKPSN